GDQHVGAARLLLARPQHVVDRALHDARERQRRLGPLAVLVGQRLDLLVEVLLELGDEAGDRPAALLDHFGRLVVDHQREQQVLEPRELVAALGGVVERVPDGRLQLRAEHAHDSGLFRRDACSGISFSRAKATTWCALVSAISKGNTPATPIPLVWTCNMIFWAVAPSCWKYFISTKTTN